MDVQPCGSYLKRSDTTRIDEDDSDSDDERNMTNVSLSSESSDDDWALIYILEHFSKHDNFVK